VSIKSLFAAAALAAVLGCGSSGPPTGKVSGTVLLKGKPLTRGTVNFLMKEKGIGAEAPIDATGKYAFATPLVAGTYAVSVTPPPPEPVPPGTRPAKTAPEIPAKFREPTSSGLSFTVKGGQNEYPIAIGN
jgi:hypothetical protein